VVMPGTMHGTKRKPATVEREMSILSSIFTMAVKNDVIDYNPCSRVRKLQFDNVQDRILRREDEKVFFSHIHSDWTADICKMVLHTGLRQNDIMGLTRFHVHFDTNRITLTQGKTQRRIDVMLNDVSREILKRRIGSEGLLFPSPATGTANGSVRHTMLRACARAKIAPLTIRDLRRTFVTRSMENGADTVTAARMAGHSSVRMISRYVRSTDLMQTAVDSLVESPTIPPAKIRKASKSLKTKG